MQEAAAQVAAPVADALPLDEQRLNDQFYQLFGPSLPTANNPDEIAPQLEPPAAPPEPAQAAHPEPEEAAAEDEPAPALDAAPSPVVDPPPTPQGHDPDDPDLCPDPDPDPDPDPVRAQLQEQIRALEQEPSAANDDPQRLQNLIEANRIHWNGTRKTLWAGSALAACLRMSVRISPPADRVALAQEAHRVAARAFQLSESAPRFHDLIACHNVLARTLHDAGQTTKALQLVRSGFTILRATAPRLRVGGHDQVTEMRQLLKILEGAADHP
ncbi:MAG: hypothetical protein IPK80_19835 [Nannocystis sp.]|nr:hypothetical protein [Nannocystis sp.]